MGAENGPALGEHHDDSPTSNLLGKTLAIRSEAAPDYLRRLAKYLEERVAQLKRSGVTDPLTALSLATLDITDELFRAREDKSRDENDVGARLGALVAILEKVAPPEPGFGALASCLETHARASSRATADRVILALS